MLPVTTNERGTEGAGSGAGDLHEELRHRGLLSVRQRSEVGRHRVVLGVEGEVQAPAGIARPRRATSASTARSLARSSVSTSTWRRRRIVQSWSGTGGTASSMHCGAQASGGLNWNVSAVVSRRVRHDLGPLVDQQAGERLRRVDRSPGVCTTSDSLPAGSALPRLGRQPHPALAGDERQLRDLQVQPIAGRPAPRRRAGTRSSGATGSRTRAHACEPGVRRERIAALRLRARGERVRQLGRRRRRRNVKRGSTTKPPNTVRMRVDPAGRGARADRSPPSAARSAATWSSRVCARLRQRRGLLRAASRWRPDRRRSRPSASHGADAERAELQQRGAQRFGRRGRAFATSAFSACARRSARSRPRTYPRLELGQVDRAGAGALRRVQVLRHRRRARWPSSRRIARACSSTSNSVVSPAARLARPRMLQPQIAACGSKPPASCLRVIEHRCSMSLSERARLARAARGFDAVHDVERRQPQTRSTGTCASRPPRRSRRRGARPCSAPCAASPSSFAAQALSIGSALARADELRGAANPDVTAGVAAEQHQQPVRERDAAARRARSPRARAAARRPARSPTACSRCATCCRAPSGRPPRR